MKAVFIDTSAWIAAADADDPLHEAVRQERDRWLSDGGILVTTDYIADETLTTMKLRLGPGAAESWWEQVTGSRRMRWESVDPARQERARAWFFRHHDKSYSFTDCTSFVIMRELRLTHALTTDRHFQQAGFALLPTRGK
jgi:hypothetical protein